ncbi:MAG: ankyrin repeat domain-containing protein, partial [Planctomycetes bacterium]|nr:ankyrin repeat domain-containing protein [Planctomycetota bacterium]
LLKHKADPNIQSRGWMISPLHHAVEHNNLKVVQLLLASQANPNLSRRYKGSATPIHYAKNTEMMSLLLKNGAGIDSKDDKGNTILHNAVKMKKTDLITFLLANKADATVGDAHEITAFHVAAASTFADALLPFIEAKIDPNIKTSDDATPLHFAAKKGLIQSLKSLLEYNADREALTKSGESVLHYACAGKKRLEIIKYLIEIGCDVNLKDKNGRTPLFNAVSIGEKDIVNFLLGNKASPDVKDTEGKTPLHLAARWGKTDALKILLSKNIAVDPRDDLGRTPLFFATLYSFSGATAALLKNRADPNISNHFAETPLFWPKARGEQDIVSLLKENGAIKIASTESTESTEKVEKDTASFIASKIKMNKGIALDLSCGKGKLAMDIAQQSELYFYCFSADGKNIETLRKDIDKSGLYGSRISVYPDAPGKLNLPSNIANLIICGDEFVAGKGKLDFKELFRVLSPNGVAVIGQSTTSSKTGHTLSTSDLKSWLKKSGIHSFEIIEEGGTWACISKERAEGTDEWRFRDYNPGNTRGSKDTLGGAPLKTQWISDWVPGISAASIVIGDGRLISASLEHTKTPDAALKTPFLQAVDAYTGIELWARKGKENLPYDREISTYGAMAIDMALIEDSIFLLGGKACYEFAAATGKSRNIFSIPPEIDPEQKTKWLFMSSYDDLLIGSAGATSGVKADWTIKFSRGDSKALSLAADLAPGEMAGVYDDDGETQHIEANLEGVDLGKLG